MKRLLLLLAITLYWCANDALGQTREKKVESDGFEWYKITDGNYYGAENANGDIIIPLSRKYCGIIYDHYGKDIHFFNIVKGCGTGSLSGKIGVCDIYGNEIIAPTYEKEKYICFVYATQEEPVNGKTGFYIVNYSDSNYPVTFVNLEKSYSSPYAFSNSRTPTRDGKVESVWYDHDVYLNGQKGMKIHSKVMVSGYKGQSFKMRVCHFFYYEDGKKLWGNTSGYTTNERDQVAAWVEDRVKPTWEDTNYNDWWVFIPYSALHCNRSCTLKIASVVRDETNGNWLGDDAYVTFINYNTGNAPVYNRPMAQSPFYYPIPKFDFSNVKFDFSNINSNVPVQTGGARNYGGDYDGGNNPGGGGTPRQLYTKTCGVCHGTGTCNTCGGRGVVSALGMGKDHYCTSCRNHDGRCSSCGGRGTWKE